MTGAVGVGELFVAFTVPTPHPVVIETEVMITAMIAANRTLRLGPENERPILIGGTFRVNFQPGR